MNSDAALWKMAFVHVCYVWLAMYAMYAMLPWISRELSPRGDGQLPSLLQ